MRFEELAYAVNGQPVTVQVHARLTVVGANDAGERAAWIARVLGVLEGVRPGDGATVVFVDRAGRRIRLARDDQGGAVLTDLATGVELPYAAGHLSLDGRFDWFASAGLRSRTATDLMVVDAATFTGDEPPDLRVVAAELTEARKRLAEVEGQRRAATARLRRAAELRRRIADLEEQVPADLESLAGACRAAAQRRDELVARLDAREVPAEALHRELVEDVEPALVDALAALADACRPFGVTIDAADIEAAGVDAAGIEAVGNRAVAEVVARAVEAKRARLFQRLQRAERDLPDAAELAQRQAALEGRIATLDASLSAGGRLLAFPAAEAVLLGRAARARRVGRYKEAFPLLVDDAFAAFGVSDRTALLHRLVRLGETTQIVYLTSDPDTLAWASGQTGSGQISLWRPAEVAASA
ncbi:MAG TPA: hypothetical protein VGP90_06340 [Acidimicrobiia bacterium]|nr:hypothetical protein [Acidimicrobiia bacterium]